MTYRSRQRRLGQLACALALATVVVASTVAPASAKLAPVSAGVDQGSTAARHVVAGGWSGQVDAETGVPLSAGIPESGELQAATPFRAQGTASGSAAGESSALEWSEALALGIGVIVVVLALGLWRGQLRRPRVAEL